MNHHIHLVFYVLYILVCGIMFWFGFLTMSWSTPWHHNELMRAVWNIFLNFFFKLIFKTILVIHLRQGAQAWAEAEREKQACFPAVLGAWPDWLAGLGDKTWAQGRCPNIWPTQVPTVEYFKFLRETATLANYHMNYYPVIALSFSIRYH